MSCENRRPRKMTVRSSCLTKRKEISEMIFNKFTRKHAGFTLVEIMIVVAIIALLAAIAVPGFLRARKRSQASKILNDLRMIDAAVDQYAIETTKTTGFPVPVSDWTNYVKKDSVLFATGADMFGNDYGTQTVDTLPKVTANAWNALSDVADTAFWSPYGHF
jgi:prepilin-type N-terminal cleavage/methylation domain-containing protein